MRTIYPFVPVVQCGFEAMQAQCAAPAVSRLWSCQAAGGPPCPPFAGPPAPNDDGTPWGLREGRRASDLGVAISVSLLAPARWPVGRRRVASVRIRALECGSGARQPQCAGLPRPAGAMRRGARNDGRLCQPAWHTPRRAMTPAQYGVTCEEAPRKRRGRSDLGGIAGSGTVRSRMAMPRFAAEPLVGARRACDIGPQVADPTRCRAFVMTGAGASQQGGLLSPRVAAWGRAVG